MKAKTILFTAALLSAPVLANTVSPSDLGLSTPQGEAVVINGKTFYKDAPQAFSLRALFGFEDAPDVYAGETLRDSTGLVSHTTSGLILIKADKETAQSAAKQEGLTLVSHVGSIAVLKADNDTELTELVAQLDAQGLKAQLELFNSTLQPE